VKGRLGEKVRVAFICVIKHEFMFMTIYW